MERDVRSKRDLTRTENREEIAKVNQTNREREREMVKEMRE